MKDNQVDLKHVLNEIKDEKSNYLELMEKKEKQLGEKIDLIFSKSKLMYRYVFEKDKNITAKDIYQEFLDVDEELKMKYQESKKDEEAKNNIDDF